jgi:DNA invertase Pin-like site-specific DNA recombinase
VLLVDNTSRISRTQGETLRIVERLSFLGVRIVAVSQGYDSQSEQADVLMTVHGLVDSLYIKELAKKTYSGLQGRALQGFHTGGRFFGYDSVAEANGVRLRINPSKAVTAHQTSRRALRKLTAADMSIEQAAEIGEPFLWRWCGWTRASASAALLEANVCPR